MKWKANSFRVNFDLHRAGSLWFWPLLFMFARSSVRFELLPVYEKVMHTAFSYETTEETIASVPANPIEHPCLGWIQARARESFNDEPVAKTIAPRNPKKCVRG